MIDPISLSMNWQDKNIMYPMIQVIDVNEKRKQIADENYEIVKKNLAHIPKTCQLYTKPINGRLKSKNCIEFISSSTNQAMQYYTKKYPGCKIAVLNFANSKHPGGGYLKGSFAQEEELCRTSCFLFASLYNMRQKFYQNWGKNWSSKVLYTPNVLFIRNDGCSSNNNYDHLPMNELYYSSVITAAAPNLRKAKKLSDIPSVYEYENIIKQIYYTPIVIFEDAQKADWHKAQIPTIYHIDILILGAWGCGSFAPPFYKGYNKFVAERFVNALSQVGGHYKKICFAIPAGENHDVFFETFRNNSNNFTSVTHI